MKTHTSQFTKNDNLSDIHCEHDDLGNIAETLYGQVEVNKSV